MNCWLRGIFVGFIAFLFTVIPFCYYRQRERSFRNFREVEPGILFRSGQLSLTEIEKILLVHQIKTVICLRHGNRPDDQEEERYVKKIGLNHVRISPQSWSAGEEACAPAEEGLQVFREIMKEPKNHPVLIHCFAGIHRTGAFCAVYRMDFSGWPKEKALAEMKALGFRTYDTYTQVKEFFEGYQPQP